MLLNGVSRYLGFNDQCRTTMPGSITQDARLQSASLTTSQLAGCIKHCSETVVHTNSYAVTVGQRVQRAMSVRLN